MFVVEVEKVLLHYTEAEELGWMQSPKSNGVLEHDISTKIKFQSEEKLGACDSLGTEIIYCHTLLDDLLKEHFDLKPSWRS